MTPNEIAYIRTAILVTEIAMVARTLRAEMPYISHRESFDRARVIVAASTTA